jgi:thermitase
MPARLPSYKFIYRYCALSHAVLVLALVAPAAARADIIVQHARGTTFDDRADSRFDAGVELVDTLPIVRTEVVEAAPGDQSEALAALNADPDVVYAEPDLPVHAFTNDSYWTSLWGLYNNGSSGGVARADISVPEAWSLTQGTGATVAVVDTGVTFAQQDLAGRLTGNPGDVAGNGLDDDHNGFLDDSRGWDWVTDDNAPDDEQGHGTHVTGTIAAVAGNGVGIAGVAPQAKVVPLRALDAKGSGTMSDIAAAFAYAGNLGIRVVNASLGGGDSQTLRNAIASHPNTLYVVAAGNDAVNDDDPASAEYPCAYTLANVLCVGASDRSDKPASFSNYGRTSVDLYAPGVDIVSTYKSSPTSYALLSGTSMATPHVAGTAALMWAANPRASVNQVKSALMSTVDVKPALGGLSVTGGRLDAGAAVAAISGAAPEALATPAPTTPAPAPATAPAPPPAAAPAPSPVATPPAPPPAHTGTHLPVLRKLEVRRAAHGRLRVTFSLSRAARVRFTVLKGSVRKSSWTARARSGANAFTFPRRGALARGRYRLAVGLTAHASSARFSVR